jgi:ribonuclease BN (tRNA processing enzyme)
MEQNTLTVLGCGDAFNCGGRGHTCFLLQLVSTGIMIDCGTTALEHLKRERIDTAVVDTVLISHFHGDHMGGLPNLLFDAARSSRTKPLTVVTPPGGRTRFEALFNLLYPGSLHSLSKLDLQYREYSGADTLTLDGFVLKTQRVKHKNTTDPHGLRLELEGGAVLAYSGDSAWTDTLPLLSRGADLFICDCTYYDREDDVHMRWTDLEPHLEELGAKRIVLTHLDDEMLQRRADLPLNYLEDGMRISF